MEHLLGGARRHVRDVCAIENTIFPRPWSSALFLSELAQGSTRLYYVALLDGVLRAYAGAMLVTGECHITTVGTAADHTRKLQELQSIGVTQFNIYLMCGDEEQTLEVYDREVLSAFSKPKKKKH